MMNYPKYPFWYFLVLLLVLVISILFWLILFDNVNSVVYTLSNRIEANPHNNSDADGELVNSIGRYIVPIDTSMFKMDSVTHQKFVADRINIALKDSNKSVIDLAKRFREQYPGNEYHVIYIDTIVNRIQVKVPAEYQARIKTEIKQKLPEFKLLVWDESLFTSSKSFNDPIFQSASTNWYYKTINIEPAWEKTTGSNKVIIAVIDNGFDLAHPELINKTVLPYNVTAKTTDVKPSRLNHGTHVSSIIGANGGNEKGLVGICPDCLIMPIKIQDENGVIASSYVIDAILYAVKNKASIINMSLGPEIHVESLFPLELQEQIIETYGKDEEEFWNTLYSFTDEMKVTCVIAAGNDNMLTGFAPFQRSKIPIKVGAINSSLNKAQFSNFGTMTTIYAPGTSITAAHPGNSYETLEGTSMATPIVSGFIGLIKSLDPNITGGQLKESLKSNTVQQKNLPILKYSTFNNYPLKN